MMVPPNGSTSLYSAGLNPRSLPPQAPTSESLANSSAKTALEVPTTDGSPAVKSTRAEQFNVDALVNKILGFTQGRLARAMNEGASDDDVEALWQSAEAGVKQGFAEAKDVLDSLNILDEALTLKIDSAYGQLMDTLQSRVLDRPTAVESIRSVSSTEALINRTQQTQYERHTFSLDLTTLQGDKIVIRAVAQQSLSSDDLSFGRLSASRWDSNQDSAYQLIVQGDLNAQESADLDALLASVNELATAFYEGDLSTAFRRAQSLGIDGTHLRSLDLSLSDAVVAGASSYAQVAEQPTSLPKGLSPLKQYIEHLEYVQSRWSSLFNSEKDLLKTILNHPLNDGYLSDLSEIFLPS